MADIEWGTEVKSSWNPTSFVDVPLVHLKFCVGDSFENNRVVRQQGIVFRNHFVCEVEVSKFDRSRPAISVESKSDRIAR